jgi:hypothetical protein
VRLSGQTVSAGPWLDGRFLGPPRVPWRAVAALAMVAVLAAFVAFAPLETPSPPKVGPPSPPRVTAPGGPAIAVSPPGLPRVSAPGLPSTPNLGSPSVHLGVPSLHLGAPSFHLGGESEEGGSTESSPHTYRHLTIDHILHSHINWILEWPLLLIIALALPPALSISRKLRPRRLVVPLVICAALFALAGATVVRGWHQLPGPGVYVSHPIEVVGEHEDSAGNRVIEEEKRIDHYRPSLDARLAWLLACAALLSLSVPSGTAAFEDLRGIRRRRALRRAEAKVS